jgi:ABC-type phosphate/phosphonate transport system ATPase subunit
MTIDATKITREERGRRAKRSRVAIARALAPRPDFVVADEPVADWMCRSRRRSSISSASCGAASG